MSHKEALEDKIPIQKDSKGFNWYYPPCKICGTPVPNWSYIRSANYICNSCRKELVRLEFESRGNLLAYKKEEKLMKALKRIEKGQMLMITKKQLCLYTEDLIIQVGIKVQKR